MNSSLKQALRSKQVTVGSWITFPNSSVAEIMARAGFDWLSIDLEHGPIGIESVHHLIQVIELCGCVPLVRLPGHDPIFIRRVMDAGAHGVIVPQVNTPEDAIRVRNCVKYPPLGRRGMGLARAQGYGERFHEYAEEVNRSGIIIAQIEDKLAVKNIEAILEVEDIDGIMIGPYDLSGSLGVPGQFDHPAMREAEEKILQAAHAKAVAVGFHVIQPSVEEVRKKVEQGFTFIAHSVDMIMLGSSCRNSVRELRGSLRPRSN